MTGPIVNGPRTARRRVPGWQRSRLLGAATLAVAALGCFSPTDYDRRIAGVGLVLSAGAARLDSIPADGASLVLVEIAAPSRARGGLTADLAVSAGSLQGGTKDGLSLPLAAGDTVRARWQAPTAPGPGVLTVKVGGIQLPERSVTFVRVVPDSITVEPEAAVVTGKGDGKVAIDVRLWRAAGTASLGTAARLTADTSGVEFGRILLLKASDASGVVTAQFAPGETTYRRSVTIRAEVTVAGVTRSDTTWVTVID